MNDRCIRCGKAVPWDHSVCRDCNPANLPSPSPTQLHATVYLAVLAAMVVLVVILVVRG
jgi:predicted nucleic acid-binding Zn ribbon protein